MSDERDVELSKQLMGVQLENAALQHVCAALIAEVSLLSNKPWDKFAQITAGLQGSASATAEIANSPLALPYTEAIERVTHMAEMLMPPPPTD